MNIGIDIRSILKRKTGAGYYTLNILNSLARIDKQNNYLLYSKIRVFSNKKLPALTLGKNFRHVINRLNINPQFLLRNMDVFFTPSFDLQKPKKSKLILTILDVIHKSCPESGYFPETIEYLENNLKKILPSADIIIVPSLITKNDIIRCYRVNKEKIHLIYPGINGHLHNEGLSITQKEDFLKKHNLSLKPFILFVGTLGPRKNIEGLINAYKILKDRGNLEHKLVIAGMKGWSYDTIFNLVEKYGLDKDVIFTGYLEEDELGKFYKTADIFVYPSFYEGIGLPVLEALSFGLPVVTSKSSSMSEIALDAAILVDPHKPEEITEGISRLINDIKLRQDLKIRALRRAKELSWEDNARKTLDIFDSCIK